MIVTINTDASFSHVQKKGTFAFWIVSNQGRICKSGVLKGETKEPTHAEIKAICNAIYTLSLSEWTNISKVVINTDSMNSIHLLSHNKKAIKKYRLKDKYAKEVSLFNKVIHKCKYNVELRHVRSHVSTATSRQWVNEWCDQEAKKHLRKFINDIQNES